MFTPAQHPAQTIVPVHTIVSLVELTVMDCGCHSNSCSFSPPFCQADGLFYGLEKDVSDGLCLKSNVNRRPDRLPSHPQTKLTPSSLLSFLREDLTTPQLDEFLPWLWLVATQDSAHISSLTRQVVRGREIVVTENPELHLVWHDKRIFIKPMPPFLLSYDFWAAFFPAGSCSDSAKEAIRQAILGYMRSYTYLIQHPSDFTLAVEKHLLPVDCNTMEDRTSQQTPQPSAQKITYFSFITFMEYFDNTHVPGTKVSARYQYGDLRLGRLNFWAKFALGRFVFQKAYGNYDAYFSRFYGPLLFAFGVLSITMSAIQLGFTSEKGNGPNTNWKPLYEIGKWFSVVVLVGVCSIGLSLLGLFVFMGGRETVFATRELGRKYYKKHKENRIGSSNDRGQENEIAV